MSLDALLLRLTERGDVFLVSPGFLEMFVGIRKPALYVLEASRVCHILVLPNPKISSANNQSEMTI